MSLMCVDQLIGNSLLEFKSATMSLLASRALQKRIDTKFVFHQDRLSGLLGLLQYSYAIVQTQDMRIAKYKNLYFDTETYLFLREHHRDRRPRFKVRIRHHCDRSMSFAEVKKKSASDRTVKHRRAIPYEQEDLSGLEGFIKEHCSVVGGTQLKPSLRTDFNRITLVGMETYERITIDTQLQCSDDVTNASWGWSKGVIVEVKQERFSPRTPVMLALRSIKSTALSISKYCTAASHLLPNINMKLYRPKMRQIRNLVHDRAF